MKNFSDFDIKIAGKTKHKAVVDLPAGTKMFKLIYKGNPPFSGTGKHGRYTSESPSYNIQNYMNNPTPATASGASILTALI